VRKRWLQTQRHLSQQLYTFNTVEEFWWCVSNFTLSLSLSLSLVVYLILGLILKFGDFVHVLVFMVIWVCVGIIPLC
jgi:hypothetical protein